MNWEKYKADYVIPETVHRHALIYATWCDSYCRYLYWIDDKLMIRTFAFKLERKTNALLLTEIERSFVGEEMALRKNCYFTQMSGYKVVYSRRTMPKRNYYGYTYSMFCESDFDIWFTDKIIPERGKILNIDSLYEIPKYKYCGYSGKQSLKEYLEAYEADSSVEFFGKAGLKWTKAIAKKMKKDKQFRRFCVDNAENVNLYGYQVTNYAYTHKVSFSEAEDVLIEKREADQHFKNFESVPYKVDRVKIRKWFLSLDFTNDGDIDRAYIQGCWRNGYQRSIGWYSYRDYWNACVMLGYDMRDTKNSMPKNLIYMHDLRIDEWKSKKAALDAKKKRSFDKLLAQVANEYDLNFEDDKFTVRLPQSKKDFVFEGKTLHHCVGTMGYDQKVVDGKILIAFIRLKADPGTPLFTVEYDLKQSKIVQMHGDHNCRPSEDGEAFIREWAKAIKGVQKRGKKKVS